MGVLDTPVVRRVRQSPRLRPPAIAAYRLVDRLTPAPPGPRVVANSMPKSGTHLLATLLDALQPMRFAGRLVTFDIASTHAPAGPLNDLERTLRLLRPSHYVGAHLIRDEEVERRLIEDGACLLTILRDPRAVVLSGTHYVLTATQLRDRDRALELFPDEESILRAMVRGHGRPGEEFYFPEIGERYRAYALWADSAAGLTVKFEDLVGDRGGGDAGVQVERVADVMRHLGKDPGGASEVADRLFSTRAITFRSGRIDSWRDDMPAEIAAEIAERCSDSMARLGYGV